MAGPQRILIVEDHEDQRILLRYQLGRIGSFAITEAADGQQALDLVTHMSYDLVIMNLGLPVLDGWEAMRRIRALSPPLRDVPILVLTAYATPGEEQKARAAGCDEYQTKPIVDFPRFRQKVITLLAKGRIP